MFDDADLIDCVLLHVTDCMGLEQFMLVDIPKDAVLNPYLSWHGARVDYADDYMEEHFPDLAIRRMRLTVRYEWEGVADVASRVGWKL